VQRFKITLNRLMRYGATPGCKSCETVDTIRPHSEACRARFKDLLTEAGEIGPESLILVPEGDLQPNAGQAADYLAPDHDVGPAGPVAADRGDVTPPLVEDWEPAEVVDEMFFGATLPQVETPPSGIAAACAAVDSIVAEAFRVYDEVNATAALEAAAKVVRGVADSTFPADRVRPSGKHPGWGEVCDINASGTRSSSSLEGVSKLHSAVKHCVSIDGPSLKKEATMEAVRHHIADRPGCYVQVSLPEDAWVRKTWKGAKGANPENFRKLLDRRRQSLKVLQGIIASVERCLEEGGEVTLHSPATSSIWARPEVLKLIHQYNLYSTEVVIKKSNGESESMRFVCSNHRQIMNLAALGCGAAGHPHEELIYDNLLRSLYIYDTVTPAMPTVVGEPTTEHREHETDHGDYTQTDMTEPVGFVFDLEDGEFEVPAAVTKLLDRKQTLSDPEAIKAVRTEGAALTAEGTWQLDTVVEKDELLARARQSGERIHLGEVMPICSIKHAELEPAKHRYKGRLCFRGDIVKDETGKPAIFQELSASPSNVTDLNASIAYGQVPGHKTTQADAVRAYIQAVLKSQHKTWIRLPPQLWPDSWRKKGYRQPMVLLVRSLYGHPEAGGHWERHLEDAIAKIGGAKMEGHKSCYFFAKERLMLTVYVDDLLLSGPADAQDQLWARLRQYIDMEDPEPLNRFLGRDHTHIHVDGATELAFEMEDYCADAVAMYMNLAKVSKLKHATTPFPPEGSLTLADECVAGELASSACAALMKGLWVARLARPDLQKAISDLASKVTCWSRNDDKKLYRLYCYINSTRGYKLTGAVRDALSELSLELYVDADFGGDADNVRSTSGGLLALVGPSTWFPLMWTSRRQTSTSRSTTEAEVVALAMSLFGEALPAMDMWDTLLQRRVKLKILEDNEAAIKAIAKGYSSKLRHMGRVHKVNLSSINEVTTSGDVSVAHVGTDEQVADVFTKALPPNKWEPALDLLRVRQLPPRPDAKL